MKELIVIGYVIAHANSASAFIDKKRPPNEEVIKKRIYAHLILCEKEMKSMGFLRSSINQLNKYEFNVDGKQQPAKRARS